MNMSSTPLLFPPSSLDAADTAPEPTTTLKSTTPDGIASSGQPQPQSLTELLDAIARAEHSLAIYRNRLFRCAHDAEHERRITRRQAIKQAKAIALSARAGELRAMTAANRYRRIGAAIAVRFPELARDFNIRPIVSEQASEAALKLVRFGWDALLDDVFSVVPPTEIAALAYHLRPNAGLSILPSCPPQANNPTPTGTETR